MRPFGQLSKRTNAVIHALLLIALWPGPVPVGHSHHDVPNSSLRVAELNRHLSRHHTTVTRQEAVADHEADTADWHIHWVVPGLGFAGCNGQQQVVSRDTAKADDAGTDLWQPVPPI